MNIGFFTDTYTPQVNGVVVSINIFKKELERQGHTVYIFAPAAPGYKAGVEKKTKIFRFWSFKFLLQPEYRGALPFSWKILRQIPKLKLDIVHSHTPFNLGVLALIVGRLQNLPLVHTYHTFYSEFIKSYLWKGKIITPKMIARITAAYCNQCDAIVAPSPKMECKLLEGGVKKKILVLPTGIDPKDFYRISPNDFRQKYNIPQKAKVLLFVGRLAKEKNIEFLIKAVKRISQKIDNIRLVLIGDGPHRQNLISFIKKLNLKERTIFTGYLQRQEVIKAYQSSDIFLFSSKTETQGLVILEAAASGLPVVAVKDLAFRDILIDSVNGYTTEENLKNFSQKVIKILTAPEIYKKMSVNSKKIVRKFTTSNQAQKLIVLYESLR